MNNPSYLSGKSNSSECLEIKVPCIRFETTRWSIMNLLNDSFDTFSNPWRQPLGQNHGGTWKVSNQAYNFWVCFDTWTSYMMGFIEAQVSSISIIFFLILSSVFMPEFSCRIVIMNLPVNLTLPISSLNHDTICIPFIVNSLYPIWILQNSYRQLKCVILILVLPLLRFLVLWWNNF